MNSQSSGSQRLPSVAILRTLSNGSLKLSGVSSITKAREHPQGKKLEMKHELITTTLTTFNDNVSPLSSISSCDSDFVWVECIDLVDNLRCAAEALHAAMIAIESHSVRLFHSFLIFFTRE